MDVPQFPTQPDSVPFRRTAWMTLGPRPTLTTYSYDLNAVVIDHELKNDIAASTFRQRFITLNLNDDAVPEAVVMELTGLFRLGSEAIH